jgi:hypothetical protein
MADPTEEGAGMSERRRRMGRDEPRRSPAEIRHLLVTFRPPLPCYRRASTAVAVPRWLRRLTETLGAEFVSGRFTHWGRRLGGCVAT